MSDETPNRFTNLQNIRLVGGDIMPSTGEKPLRVQVAEAMDDSEPDEFPKHERIPPYGEDTPEGWACTGPLMLRFGIGTDPGTTEADRDHWWARGWHLDPEWRVPAGEAATPCEAIARCVVALAAAGKLPK